MLILPSRLSQVMYLGVKYRKIHKKALVKVLREEGINATFKDSGVAFHVSSEGVSKGNAILKLCEIANISIDEIMCIGDGETDIDMFKVCPNSVALAHSPQHVKEYASYVTSKPYSDGFLEAVRELIGVEV